MREPSASQLALVEHCQHPFTSGTRWPYEPTSEYAGIGNLVDFLIERHVMGSAADPEGVENLTDGERAKAERLARLAIGLLEDEKKTRAYTWSNAQTWFRYDVNAGTSRISVGREPKRPGEWTYKADWVGGRDGVMCIRDWKTGRQQHTAETSKNPQMRLGAIAAARAHGYDNVAVELVYLDDDGIKVDAVDFDGFDLADIAADLKALRAKLLKGPTSPTPGPWCTQHYCKLRGICSATQAALASAYPLEESLSVDIRDEEHARWILERLPGAEAALKAVKSAVNEFSRSHPVRLRDGNAWGLVERESRSVKVETKEQRDALEDVLGDCAAYAITTEFSATLGSIKLAAKRYVEDHGDGRSAAAIARDAVEALDRAGGLKVSKYPRFDTFKPQDEEEETKGAA